MDICSRADQESFKNELVQTLVENIENVDRLKEKLSTFTESQQFLKDEILLMWRDVRIPDSNEQDCLQIMHTHNNSISDLETYNRLNGAPADYKFSKKEFLCSSNGATYMWNIPEKKFSEEPIVFTGSTEDSIRLTRHCYEVDSNKSISYPIAIKSLISYGEKLGFNHSHYYNVFLAFIKSCLPEQYLLYKSLKSATEILNTLLSNINPESEVSKI